MLHQCADRCGKLCCFVQKSKNVNTPQRKLDWLLCFHLFQVSERLEDIVGFRSSGCTNVWMFITGQCASNCDIVRGVLGGNPPPTLLSRSGYRSSVHVSPFSEHISERSTGHSLSYRGTDVTHSGAYSATSASNRCPVLEIQVAWHFSECH